MVLRIKRSKIQFWYRKFAAKQFRVPRAHRGNLSDQLLLANLYCAQSGRTRIFQMPSISWHSCVWIFPRNFARQLAFYGTKLLGNFFKWYTNLSAIGILFIQTNTNHRRRKTIMTVIFEATADCFDWFFHVTAKDFVQNWQNLSKYHHGFFENWK